MKQKRHQGQQAEGDRAKHQRVAPAGGGVAVGLDAVGDACEQDRQPETEGQRARPVQLAWRADTELPQRSDAPDGAEDADRHADPEDRLPMDLGEDSADEQAEERAGDRRHHVDAESHAALVAGNASVRIADDDAISIAPPTPWTTRQAISHIAPPPMWNGSNDSATAARVNTTKPTL